MNCDVSIARCESYDPQAVKDALRAALNPIHGLDWVVPGMKIAIKANLMMRVKPEKAATVHPQVAVALCELLVERGARVALGDSPGGPFNAAYLAQVYSSTGMRAILETGAALNDDFSFTEVSNPNAVTAKTFQVTNYLLEADAIIDLCKIKTHGLMAFTGACKNFFGAVPGMRKSEYHYRYTTHELFANMLVDICEWCKPRLSIGDAIMAMEGNGPSGGTPRFMGAILASFNPHALDLAAAYLMNLTANDVPTLHAAVERGLVPQTVSDLHVFGGLSAFVVPDFQLTPKHDVTLWGTKNAAAAKILSRFFASTPKVDRTQCVGCGECAKICPASAIRISRKRAYIDAGKCIRCFCCQEFCPKGVIRVHRPAIARLVEKLS
ncbi:MAG TPA: DUF362 domain-containing protein [Eubacteriales bacterium]|nr:DUF362 domain-containing protein [Eubacteriales bacterium]